ncbi:hypothetical protein N7492_010019 [Penicillium capsulatum]|uniref:AB hydrolase-1 domain-containing protein n=1 Tax=Penicillium capsulatum TaxID=69766 RepID=A0A9W9HQC6_9EURO|nr:hypothetical protein N7492_010019 [Penicillium capsulatum]KAJ6112527.1 hypothetical protein N7512_007851 [Penicillium capsulatum]
MTPSTWEKGQPSDLVALPAGHRLYVSISGPERGHGSPIVIIVPGVTCSITEWAAVRRLLEPTVRVLAYERAGLGASDESTEPPTATHMAEELDTLLQALHVAPPYIFVCHSYGGIITREFLELKHSTKSEDVVGVVFVDANQEKSIALWPDSNLDAMTKDLDNFTGIGLDQDHVLTENEWQAVLAERRSEKHQRTGQREMEHYIAGCEALGVKQQFWRCPPLLKDFPICVLSAHPDVDCRRMFELALKLGNGTVEQRWQYAEKLAISPAIHEKFQREILELSTKHRFVDVEGCGHYVHMLVPEAIVDAVKWVLQNI